MMELISRDSVLNLIKGVYVIKTMRSGKTIYAEAFEDIIKAIQDDLEELPIIESRPKGEWIEADLDCGKRHIRCNQCWYADCEIPKEKIKDMDYCPQCGAEMEK